MTLQELLIDLKLDEEQIKKVNAAVDSVITSKTTDLKNSLTETQEQLKPFLADAKKKKVSGMLPENANTELSDDIIALAGISDEDTDEAIKTKIKAAVDARPHLQKKISKTDPAAGEKTKEVVQPKIEPKVEPKDSKFSGL